MHLLGTGTDMFLQGHGFAPALNSALILQGHLTCTALRRLPYLFWGPKNTKKWFRKSGTFLFLCGQRLAQSLLDQFHSNFYKTLTLEQKGCLKNYFEHFQKLIFVFLKNLNFSLIVVVVLIFEVLCCWPYLKISVQGITFTLQTHKMSKNHFLHKNDRNQFRGWSWV